MTHLTPEQEALKQRFCEILSPAINVEAPYAKTMLNKLVETAWGAACFAVHLPQPPVDEPTEAMCYQARGFIMGLDLGCRKWGAIQRHLDLGGYPSLPRIERLAKGEPTGHITKWDVAECIYLLMMAKPPITSEAA